MDLLSWIIDVWFMERSFNQEQEKGNIPFDEPFSPFFIYSSGHENKFPFNLSLELRDKMPVSIEGRAMQLIDAYNTLKRESPDMTEFADKKIEKLKPFAGIYGS